MGKWKLEGETEAAPPSVHPVPGGPAERHLSRFLPGDLLLRESAARTKRQDSS